MWLKFSFEFGTGKVPIENEEEYRDLSGAQVEMGPLGFQPNEPYDRGR